MRDFTKKKNRNKGRKKGKEKLGGNDLELAIEMVENIPGEFDRPPISRRQTELERDKWQGDETRVPYPNFPPRLKNKLEGTGWRSGERNRGRGLSALGFGIFALLLPFKSSLPFDRLRIEKWRSLVALSARLKTFSANHIGISSFDISISDFYIRNFLQEYSSTKIYLRREIFVSGKNWKIVFPFFFFLWQPS